MRVFPETLPMPSGGNDSASDSGAVPSRCMRTMPVPVRLGPT